MVDKLKPIVGVILLVIWPLLLLSAQEDNSFTIIAGKNTTKDGTVILAHNQGQPGENVFVNVHKIPGKYHRYPQKILLKNGGVVLKARKTAGFLWFEIPGAEFGDSYMNENGVVIVSNTCRSREDKPGLTDGGIGFMLARIMAEQAGSARQAVEIAGKLIQQFGYYGSGQCYAIADADEGWLLQVVRGKRWAAKRVADDRAAVVANRFTIDTVDLADTANCMGSPDLIRCAVKRGWHKPKAGKPFKFAGAYADPANDNAEKNVRRQWRGTSLLAKKKFKPDTSLPFSFKPKGKIEVTDLYKILRDHYEGSEYNPDPEYKKGSPHTVQLQPICSKDTRYALVAHVRKNMPKEIANVVGVALSRPDANAFSPWYFSITTPPEGCTYGNSETALLSHFTPPQTLFTFNPRYAYWSYARLSQLVDQNYRARIRIARKEWRNFENYVLKMRRKMEKEFTYLMKINKHITIKLITNYVHKLEYRKWFKAAELISEMNK
jgi:dipeptidase